MRKLALVSLFVAMLGVGRMPERHPSRSTSFDWLSDVHERLRVLEDHAADATRERLSSDLLLRDPAGRFTPQPPAAGAGNVR